MHHSLLRLFLVSSSILLAAEPSAVTRPQSETLRYQVNWPSGLSLGEAQMQSMIEGEGSKLEFQLSAGIPGFQVDDKFTSMVNGAICSQEFRKETVHGTRKGKELITFTSTESADKSKTGKAARKTLPGGGTTEMEAASCAQDALAFLYLVRAELQKGRVPAPQTIFFGAPYQIRLQFLGSKQVKVADAPMEADQLHATVKGAKSQLEFDIFFSRDPKRTPVLVRVPFVLGTFAMEWIP
jgi:Protein of unknown function (DUF3108)